MPLLSTVQLNLFFLAPDCPSRTLEMFSGPLLGDYCPLEQVQSHTRNEGGDGTDSRGLEQRGYHNGADAGRLHQFCTKDSGVQRKKRVSALFPLHSHRQSRRLHTIHILEIVPEDRGRKRAQLW